MGRMKEGEIGRSLSRRLDAKAEPAAEPETRPVAEPAQRKRARDGMRYVGFHVSEDQFERLRTVAFETRREKQDLLREGLEHVLRKHGQ